MSESAIKNGALAAALKETLRRTGPLDGVPSQLHSTILQCADESLPAASSSSEPGPAETPPTENAPIDEPIADYLPFNGYDRALSVFSVETKGSGFRERSCERPSRRPTKPRRRRGRPGRSLHASQIGLERRIVIGHAVRNHRGGER